MKKLLVLLTLLSMSSHAALPGLESLTAGSLEKVSDDFAANFAPTTVSGASTLGKIFGIEAGAIFGLADMGNIADIGGVNSDFTKLPHAGFFARATILMGIGASFTALPISVSDFTYDYYSFGLHWTFTEVLGSLPFDARVSAFFTTAEFSYTEDLSGTPTDISYKNSSTALIATASKKFAVIEPYAKLGYIMGSGEFVAGASFFDGAVTASDKADIGASSFTYGAGLQLNLFVMNIGIEYMSAFGNSRYTGKFTFKF